MTFAQRLERQIEQSAASGMVDTRYGKVAYTVHGEGPVLVMLHGSTFSGVAFETLTGSGLAATRRLVCLDFLGHGRSENASDPDRAYTVTGLADSVEDALAALGVSEYAVFGWSLGGHVAIELAARGRGVRGLVLTGAPPVAPGLLSALSAFRISRALMCASKEKLSGNDLGRFSLACFGRNPVLFHADQARSDGRLRPRFAKSLMKGDGANQKRFVETTDLPVRIIHGESDPFLRLSFLRRLRFRSVASGLTVIRDAGHAVFLDQGGDFVGVLHRFLLSLGR